MVRTENLEGRTSCRNVDNLTWLQNLDIRVVLWDVIWRNTEIWCQARKLIPTLHHVRREETIVQAHTWVPTRAVDRNTQNLIWINSVAILQACGGRRNRCHCSQTFICSICYTCNSVTSDYLQKKRKVSVKAFKRGLGILLVPKELKMSMRGSSQEPKLAVFGKFSAWRSWQAFIQNSKL